MSSVTVTARSLWASRTVSTTLGGVAAGRVGPPGAAGPPGSPGSPGSPGPGVPAGGTTNQTIRKRTNTDYDTEWVDFPGGVSIGVAVGGGTANRVLFAGSDGKLADDAGLTYDAATDTLTAGGVWVADNGSNRKGRVFYFDAGGIVRFGRTDHVQWVGVQVNDTAATLTASVQLSVTTAGSDLVLCSREAGGAARIDLNRRQSDNSPGVGGGVRCWTRTGQTERVLEVLSPGGVVSLTGFGPSGAWHPAALSDAAAPNDSVYFSTTAGRLVYKTSAGVVNNLY